MNRYASIATVALASALALTGCAGGGETAPEATTSASAATQDSNTATTPSSETTSTGEAISAEHNDADVMFAQMMIPHHQQAVDMSETLRAKEDIPQNVRDFAQKVIDSQGPEIDQLNAMLTAWGEEPTTGESGGTEGMDHGSGSDSSMDGMMTEEDMQQLEAAQGTEAARLYLEQMTTHHRGAIDMAQDEINNGQNPQAVEMARRIVTDQQAEVQEMEQMLQKLPSQS